MVPVNQLLPKNPVLLTMKKRRPQRIIQVRVPVRKQEGNLLNQEAQNRLLPQNQEETSLRQTNHLRISQIPRNSHLDRLQQHLLRKQRLPQAPEIPQTIQVTISVQCKALVGNNNLAEPYRPYVPSNGYIQGTTQVTISKNGTVFDALQALNLNPAPTYTGSVKRKDIYITSIHHIPEKACGDQSGWKYKVNGSIPNLSCSDYTLQGGETIEWYYAEHVFD